LDWFDANYKMAIIFDNTTCHIVKRSWCCTKWAIFCCQLGTKVIPFWICLQILCNDLELFVNEVLWLFDVVLIVLQSHRHESCYSLTCVMKQTSNDIHNWYKMVVSKLMHECCYYLKIMLMVNIRSTYLVQK